MKTFLRTWLGVLLTNSILGVIPALLSLVFAHPSLPVLLEDALTGILYANSIGFPCWAILPRLLLKWQERTVLARTAMTCGVLVICCLVGCTVTNLLLVAVGWLQMAQFVRVLSVTMRICLLLTLSYGLLVSMISTLEYRLKQKELAEERAQKNAAEARFASLESRVHPHFLFNTLNSISALVREDPTQAERMIENLSALLRFSLDSELAGLVPLSEELHVVRDYLEIESVRFGERLRYSIEMAPGTESRQVPPLSVQTLVENSVKYAVGTKREGATIQVRARLDAGVLKVEVSDDGPGFDPAASRKPGHGLDLLERRLAAMFGDGGKFVTALRDGRTVVEISVA